MEVGHFNLLPVDNRYSQQRVSMSVKESGEQLRHLMAGKPYCGGVSIGATERHGQWTSVQTP